MTKSVCKITLAHNIYACFMCSMSPLYKIHICKLLRMWCGCMQYACLNVKQNSNLNCSAFCLHFRKQLTKLLLHNRFADCTISHSILRSKRLNHDFYLVFFFIRISKNSQTMVKENAPWKCLRCLCLSIYTLSFAELSHLNLFHSASCQLFAIAKHLQVNLVLYNIESSPFNMKFYLNLM